MTNQEAPAIPQKVTLRTWLKVPMLDSIAEGKPVRVDHGNERFSGVVTHVNYDTGRIDACGEWAVVQ